MSRSGHPDLWRGDQEGQGDAREPDQRQRTQHAQFRAHPVQGYEHSDEDDAHPHEDRHRIRTVGLVPGSVRFIQHALGIDMGLIVLGILDHPPHERRRGDKGNNTVSLILEPFESPDPQQNDQDPNPQHRHRDPVETRDPSTHPEHKSRQAAFISFGHSFSFLNEDTRDPLRGRTLASQHKGLPADRSHRMRHVSQINSQTENDI